MRKFILASIISFLASTTIVSAAEKEKEIKNYDFSFDGAFGRYDEQQLRRGLEIYTQVCSACHGMKYVSFRNLEDLGYSEQEIIDYAKNYQVYDSSLEDFRDAGKNDYFPKSMLLEAPDLSLMAKARKNGEDYIASLLTSYTGEEKESAGYVLYENKAYGGYINMAQPLYGEDVVFEDGSTADLESQAQDVAAFLTWSAEPKLNVRKKYGATIIFVLTLLTVLLFLNKKQIWHKKD